jgi:putative ABC transport system permease protein
LDEQIDALYRSEQQISQIFSVFALLAVLIACLGLFGLAAYAAEQRTKEIGVRKVLGASVPQIVMLLSKDFTRLVLVAFVVAVPLAYIAMQRWLDSFAFRIEISWPIFLIAGLATLGVAWLTVGYQSVKAALSDPAKSLRYE